MESKSFVEWNQKYEIGVDFIDEQHRSLVRLINELHAGLQDRYGDRPKAFEKAAHQAVEYVKTHFSAEENWMKLTGFAGYDRQRAEHAQFVKQLIECSRAFKPHDLRPAFAFVKFLAEWLMSHIAIEDNNFRFHLQASSEKARRAEKG